ncbi:integral membrane protein [Fusarium pseudocircinatum]|uniref:Integral membrane protein n=1 Tax=Fusarium pseudocircinatum TaxID=56676 RepID=A0A8H5PF36_9HYPO|nr:integral membrane protein [Fusarium pseudocircinatum]
MAVTEQEAAHTHLVMVILVVCFALCVALLFVALRFWCRYIIGFSYWDDAAAVMALCAPLEAVWNRNLRMKCVTNRLELAYICAGINIVTDIVVAILPLPVIWRLNLRQSQKIALSVVFGLGCFSIALAIVRIKWVETWSFITWDIVRPQLWALAEVTSALVCACIPTFKPLVSKINAIIVGRRRNATEFVLEEYRSDVEFNAGSTRNNEDVNGLIRHDTGRLFPYNPEFYSTATGLYGPGTIYCWYMLLVSVLISWALCLADEDGPKKPGLSNDLLGALAYPVFAATDLVVQSMRILGMEERALAIFCLRNPEVNLDLFGPFNTTQLDLNHIPPDTVILGQRVVDITGPLTICYFATPFLLILIVGFMIDAGYARNWNPKPSARWVVNVAYGYISLMLTVFHFSLGDIGTSLLIALYEAMLPVMLTFIYLFTAFIGLTFLTGIIMLVWSMIKKNYKDAVEALKALGGCIFFAGMLVVPSMLMIHRDRSTTIPDLGIRVSERDQLATLIVGVVTLTFTVVDVFRNFYRERHREEVTDAEMQMLPATDGAIARS